MFHLMYINNASCEILYCTIFLTAVNAIEVMCNVCRKNWILAEAVNMNAGFGFNGYDEHGNARWDLIDNANIWKIEVTALKRALS